MKNKSRAFSLIELSIVILIIGILIAGVTQSSRLVRESKLRTAQTLTKSSPVSGIKGLSAWFETSLDESFIADEMDENVVISQWNDINPQSSSKYFLNAGNVENAVYQASAGANGLPSIYFTADGQQIYMSDLKNIDYVNDTNKTAGFTFTTSTLFVVYTTTKAADNSIIELYNDPFWEYLNANAGVREIDCGSGYFADASSNNIPTA